MGSRAGRPESQAVASKSPVGDTDVGAHVCITVVAEAVKSDGLGSESGRSGRHVVSDPCRAGRDLVVHRPRPVVVISRCPTDDRPTAFQRDSVDLSEEGVDDPRTSTRRFDEEIIQVAAHHSSKGSHPLAQVRQPVWCADLVSCLVNANRHDSLDAAIVLDPSPYPALVLVGRKRVIEVCIPPKQVAPRVELVASNRTHLPVTHGHLLDDLVFIVETLLSRGTRRRLNSRPPESPDMAPVRHASGDLVQGHSKVPGRADTRREWSAPLSQEQSVAGGPLGDVAVPQRFETSL